MRPSGSFGGGEMRDGAIVEGVGICRFNQMMLKSGGE